MLFKISAVFMFTPRMVKDECSQQETTSAGNIFPNFFKYQYHRLLSRNAACGFGVVGPYLRIRPF